MLHRLRISSSPSSQRWRSIARASKPSEESCFSFFPGLAFVHKSRKLGLVVLVKEDVEVADQVVALLPRALGCRTITSAAKRAWTYRCGIPRSLTMLVLKTRLPDASRIRAMLYPRRLLRTCSRCRGLFRVGRGIPTMTKGRSAVACLCPKGLITAGSH